MAAGGGLPQWNCHCRNCLEARAGNIPSLTQSSIAVTADGQSWFLVNASPDLRTQIEGFPSLQPVGTDFRSSPIEAVLLTNADLDHVLGLLLLREGESLSIHATPAVRETLVKGLRLEALLGAFCGVTWHEPPLPLAPLLKRNGQPSGLTYRAIPLSDVPPLYYRDALPGGAQSIAYLIRDERSGGKLLIAPDVEALTPELLMAIHQADAILFDGTFWSNDELQRVKPAARTALEMGHLPIINRANPFTPGTNTAIVSHSLNALRISPAPHKIYLHINNTNPILRPGPERWEVEAAGVSIGLDGQEFSI